ncbi:hypothetical protein RUM44_008601 [Polyplax serrata]|uniref:Protein kintoun n=1 Tax=Polyplax serrata TaxID=468196 RepID=A0ABR1BDL8_POLSC
MARFNRKDWEDLNITREEVENLSQALKKEEFRKLLSEYAEEITDPKNRKQYQEDIVKLEAERGIECTFVNPEPGFVVKTSVDGNKKAFINICKNKAVGRPTSKPEVKNDSRGLSWSIPLCQAPGREDFDKKKNRCVVYDVIFHPDTLHLAEKNPQFKQLVIETALNAVEESYKVSLDKKNIKLPRLGFKGLPFATVIRKKSKTQPVINEEDVEFLDQIKYPFKPPKEEEPIVRSFESKKIDSGKYTIPKYVVKHQSDIDMQEFTYDKNAKLNAAIPKQLVIEINLPMLSSTQSVTLDIMEKSLHLLSEKPAKYKLDIQLPYSVNEETGNAKFDKERRLLIVTLPVIKAKMTIKDLMREDSGVESDFSPIGSITNNEFANLDECSLSNEEKDSYSIIQECTDILKEEFELSDKESDKEIDHRTKREMDEFLESDKHYTLPSFTCNIDGNNICFVLKVKNVDSTSLVKKCIDSNACHVKFYSIGSGFFPVYYAFFVDFKDECNIQDVICEAWDNNVTVLIEFVKNRNTVTHYYAGLDENSLTQQAINHPIEFKKMDACDYEEDDDDDDDDEECQSNVKIESACVDEVVVTITPQDSSTSDGQSEEDDDDDDEVEQKDDNKDTVPPSDGVRTGDEKCRTLSESGVDDIASSCPIVAKGILKKRINRSLSESNADDYLLSSSSAFEGSNCCIHEEEEVPCVKKTVRFSKKIKQQFFRVNSSILARKNKNKKKQMNKKRAMERRLSESENSEVEEKEREQKTTKKPKKQKQHQQQQQPQKKDSLIQVVSKDSTEGKENKKQVNAKPTKTEKVPEDAGRRLKKDDKIFEFKSDLIFDLDV